MQKGFIRLILGFFLVFTPQLVFAQNCIELETCSSYALNDVAAAFNTEGYYAQSKMLEQVRFNVLGGTESTNESGKGIRLIAPIMYILSVAGAIFMMGFGQPPKMWIWFLIGPGIFHFLVNTTVDKKGVAWIIGGTTQGYERVWKLSQVGISNLPDTNANQVYDDKEPDFDAKVSQIFSLYDDTISHFVQMIVMWLGVFEQREGNLQVSAPSGGSNDTFWYIMSNSKWPMLEGITGSLVHNSDLREALVVLMTNECGDIINRNISQGDFARAAKGDATSLPESVFMKKHSDIIKELAGEIIPTPQVFRELIRKIPSGSTSVKNKNLSEFDQKFKTVDADKLPSISCADLMYTVIQGIRFEAGHVYFQTLDEAAEAMLKKDGSNRDEVHKKAAYSFLYGWDFDQGGTKLSDDDKLIFIKSLIVFHLMRNELSMAPSPGNVRFGATTRLVNYGEQYQRTIGSKQKFSELYQWAKLLPYMQGLLLYFLCISYPLACMLMVVPGWWKTLITWATFYAWAKSWDIGFALVMSVERSIWGMLGSSDNAVALNSFLVDGGSTSHLASYKAGKINVTCGGTNCDELKVVDGISNLGYDSALKMFDVGLLLSAALDLDLRNSYYIYLMSALYFAVPAVTGQIILGAKAGAAGLVTNAFQQNASEFGGKAGAGALDYDVTRRMNAKESMGQENVAREHRESGLAAKAFASQNEAAMQGLRGSTAGGRQSVLGIAGQQSGWNREKSESTLGFENAVDRAQVSLGRDGAKAVGEYFKAQATSSAPSSTGATTGSAQTTGASKSKVLGGLRGVLGTAFKNANEQGAGDLAVNNALTLMNDLPTQAAKHAVMLTAQGQQAKIASETASAQLTGFHAQAESGRLQQAGGRYEAAAQHQASESAWRKQRDFGESMSGRLGAMGMSPGAMAAGPRSTDMRGLAQAGRLDTFSSGGASGSVLGGQMGVSPVRMTSNAAGAYNFFNNGGEMQQANNTQTHGLAAYGTAQGVFNGMDKSFNAGLTAPASAMSNLGVQVAHTPEMSAPFAAAARTSSAGNTLQTAFGGGGLTGGTDEADKSLVKIFNDRK